MTPIIPIGFACSLLVAPAMEREVVLEVDHSRLLDEQVAEAAEDTVFFVRSDSTKLLREEHGVEVRDDANPSTSAIIVRLSWIDYEESLYRVVVETRRPGHDVRVLEEFECECAGSQLTSAILARLPAALEQLDQDDDVPSSPEPNKASTPPAPEEEPAESVPHERRLGPLGWAGIGVGVGGAALVAGGLVLLPRDLVTRGTPRAVEARSPRSLGIGLAAGGGVAIAAGVSMLVIDLVRRRPSKVAVFPSGGTGHAGVSFALRF